MPPGETEAPSRKEGEQQSTPPLEDIDALAMKRASELVPLNDREITSQRSASLIGARGNGVTAIDTDRRRGKAWVRYEIVFSIDVAS